MASLGRYLLRRGVQGILTVLIVTIIIFILFKLEPGSPLDVLRSTPNIPLGVINQVAAQYGLNDPVEVQLYKYILNMFTFQFGVSVISGGPVIDILHDALPRTLFLFGGAVIIEYIIGVLIGRYIAWKRGRGVEGAVILTSLFFYNMPSFWIGLILLFVFAYLVSWFPLRGFTDPTWTATHYPILVGLQGVPFQTVLGVLIVLGGVGMIALAWLHRPKTQETRVLVPRFIPGAVTLGVGGIVSVWQVTALSTFDVMDILIHGFLPMLALVLISAAGTILLMQTSMLEVMGEDFILTAKAKGLSERIVRKRHAARNAYLPIVTSLAISMGFVVGGAIILEYIFSYYGLGSYLLMAITRQDRFLAGAILFLISVLVIGGNIIADMLYGVLDPRVRI